MEVDAKVPLSRLSAQAAKDAVELPENERVPQAGSLSSLVRKFTAPAIVKQVQRQEAIQPKPKSTTPLYVPETTIMQYGVIDINRFNPEAEGAIVMKQPTVAHQQRFNPK